MIRQRRRSPSAPRLESLEPRTLLALSVPALSSLPGAPAALYLDFDGDFIPKWSSYTNITIPAYDRDGDPTSFTDAELAAITEIWKRVAEDYAPFNINVTTVEPTNLTSRAVLRVDIGGDSSWVWPYDPYGYNGIAGGYMEGMPFVVFVFSKNNGNGDPKYTAEGASHEAGHAYGLDHQSLYDASGNRIAEYYKGPGDGTAPIMGNSLYYTTPLSRWWYGPNAISSTTYQDDMAVLAGPGNGFGYRPDDHGNTAATASPLAVSGSQVNASGIITATADLDVFSFTTGAGQVSLTVAVETGINNLVPRLELWDAGGSRVIATAGPDANQWATITTTLAAGSYRLAVFSNGGYGNVGQYTVRGTIVPATSVINPPTNLAAVAVSTSQVNLTWSDNATNETAYGVERSLDGVAWSTIAGNLPANSTSFADTAAAPGTTYFYRIRASSGSASSDYSNQATATTITVAPSGLAATAISSNRIDLGWSDVAGETGFRVERSLDGIAWSVVGSTGANVLSFSDTGVSASTTYQYRVQAWNAGGGSAYSSTASASTPATLTRPVAPSGLVATAVSTTRVFLSWKDNSGNESGFRIERSANNGKSWSQIAQTGADATTFTDTSVMARKTYQYRVYAFNGAGDSGSSNVAAVQMPQKAPALIEEQPGTFARRGKGIRVVRPPAHGTHRQPIRKPPGPGQGAKSGPGRGPALDLLDRVLAQWSRHHRAAARGRKPSG
jgi:hypothetical protein